MVFKLKSKVGYPVLGLVAFTFLVLLPLNVITLFSDEGVNPGSLTAVATEKPNGHLVWVQPSPSGPGYWVCVCGAPYTCSGCKPVNYPPSHWERIGGRWICVCGGSNFSSCGLCLARRIY